MDILDVQKFGEYYKKTIVDSDKQYFIKYHMHRYAIENLTDSQIIDSFNTPWCKNKELCEIFRDTSKTWQKVIEKQLDDVIKEIMISHSISLGEAMIIADDHFDKEIGYLQSFLSAFGTTMEIIRVEGAK